MTSALGGVPKKQMKGTKSRQGGGVKIRKICGRHIWKPPNAMKIVMFSRAGIAFELSEKPLSSHRCRFGSLLTQKTFPADQKRLPEVIFPQ